MALIALRGDGPIHGMVVWAARMPLELPEVGIPTREGPSLSKLQKQEAPRTTTSDFYYYYQVISFFCLSSFLSFFPLPYLLVKLRSCSIPVLYDISLHHLRGTL